MLAESAIFLAAAGLAVSLFKRLGLGSVLGYIAAGVLGDELEKIFEEDARWTPTR